MGYKQIQNEWGEWVLQPDNTPQQSTKPAWEMPEYALSDVMKQYGTPQTPYTTSYTPQSFTGAMGGNAYAAQPDLNKYEAQPFDLGKTLSSWMGGIGKAWENLVSPKPAAPQQGIKPFWEAQPVGAQEERPTQPKSWADWEATGPYQVPTEKQGWEQKNWGDVGKNVTAPDFTEPPTEPYEARLSDTGDFEWTPFKKYEGYGKNEGYAETPSKVLTEIGRKPTDTHPALIGDKDAQSYLQKLATKAADEKTLTTVINTAIKRGVPVNVDPAQLDTIKDKNNIENIHNYGLKIPKVINMTTNLLNQINSLHPGRMKIDMSKLGQVEYNSLVNALGELESLSDQEWKAINDKNMTVSIKYTRTGANAFGEDTYRADVEYKPPYETEEEKETKSEAKRKAKQAESDAEETAKYWSAKEVADRNRRRQESADWSEAQSQQGWSEFYRIMGNLKMSPEMDDYFNNPTMFNDLRRQWKAVGGTWESFISNYDFKEAWGKLSPSRRGERPAVFSPRMRSTS